MPPHRKDIPFYDVKGLKTLLGEGKNVTQIANYYEVSRRTVRRRIEELEAVEKETTTKR